MSLFSSYMYLTDTYSFLNPNIYPTRLPCWYSLSTIYSSLIFESNQIHPNRQLNVFKLELFTSFLIRFAFFSSRINI